MSDDDIKFSELAKPKYEAIASGLRVDSVLPRNLGGVTVWVPTLSQAAQGDTLSGFVEDPNSGYLIPADNGGMILTRTEFEAMVIRAREFYERLGTDERIGIANRANLLTGILEETFVDPSRNARAGWVYVIEAVGQGIYKIGKTEHLARRLRQFATASPFEVRVIESFEVRDIGWLEQVLHRRYAGQRVRGEWFRLDDEDLRMLRDLRAFLGDAKGGGR